MRVCKYCGAELFADSNFCSNVNTCGRDNSSASDVASKPAQKTESAENMTIEQKMLKELMLHRVVLDKIQTNTRTIAWILILPLILSTIYFFIQFFERFH